MVLPQPLRIADLHPTDALGGPVRVAVEHRGPRCLQRRPPLTRSFGVASVFSSTTSRRYASRPPRSSQSFLADLRLKRWPTSIFTSRFVSSRASQAFVSFWYSPKDFPTNPATGRRPRLGFAGTFAAFTAAFTAADLVVLSSLAAAAARCRAASSRCRRLASRSPASDAGSTSAAGTEMRICWPGRMFGGTRTLIVRPSGARTWRTAFGAVPAGIWICMVVLMLSWWWWCCPRDCGVMGCPLPRLGCVMGALARDAAGAASSHGYGPCSLRPTVIYA